MHRLFSFILNHRASCHPTLGWRRARSCFRSFGFTAFNIFLVLSISACSSKKVIPICAFADGTNIAAPMWLCDVMDSNTLIKTTAYADYSSSGKDFVLKMATTTAAMEALSQLRIKLQTSFINISESSGTEAPPIPLTWLTSVSDQFTVPDVLSLAETRELATPTKGVVVVFQLPKTSTEEWLNTTLQQSPLSGIDSELKSAFIQALLQDLMN